LLAADASKFFDECGQKIHSFYGASECGGICYDAGDEPGRPDGFVGTALPGVHLEARQIGEGIKFGVRSPAVGSAYFPSLTDDALSASCFHPADILEECDGGYRIIGRESDVINIAGRKVNPSEIERVLLSDPRVNEAVVFAVPSASSRGEVPAACVVGEISESELKSLCAANMPSWKTPRHWIFLSEIPKNSRGKISRKDLALRFGQ
jgi:acyl-coenzyme A synthetase/AMP-(fatty) acid ligase